MIRRSLLLLLSLGPGCAGEEPAPVWFEEQSSAAGLEFQHVRATETRFQFPEIMGAGAAFLDADSDGWLDVYLVQSGDLASPLLPDSSASEAHRNRLFQNNAAAGFTDVSAASGADDPGYGMGVAVGDASGDGQPDLFVTNVGPNAFLRNAGDCRFEDQSRAAGLAHPGWGTSAAFLDFDSDGMLDLVVVNYLEWAPELEVVCDSPHGGQDYCSPNAYGAPARDLLYRNRGDGTFEDVTEHAGLGQSFGNGLGVSVADFDADGHVDIYVANDMMPNQLWRNGGAGTFEDVALLAGCAANMDGASEAGMGTVAVDLEHDGDLDLFLTHLRAETNTFYENLGGYFADRTARLGLAAPSLRFTGFGVGFADFDHDGLSDLFVANGAVTRNQPPLRPGDPYAEPDQLYRGTRSTGTGTGELVFEEIRNAGLGDAGVEARVHTTRGAALGDWDNDGDVDILVVDSNEPARLLTNVARKRGSWIGLDLRLANGASAIGASAILEAPGLTRHVLPAASYCSSNDPRLHFGLGSEPKTLSVLVRWTDGAEERFDDLASESYHTLRRGSGRAESD